MNTIRTWLLSLKLYLQMSLFLASPSSLPYSPAALVLSVGAYLLVGQALLGEVKNLFEIGVQIAIEILILYLISYAVLTFKKKQGRLLQTLSALIGINLIISIASLLLVGVLPDMQNTETPDPLLVQLNLAILLWNMAVVSLIFKRAFEIKTIVAAIIAFNYLLIYEFIILNFL
ncbi:MAG: hypothetical protein H8E21_10845 [Gammaproteobacteria bacterium]|nr:hypothetical protein [Gammaproteobacteria bacterium]MBL6999026.1 hypothetical protein [Gammaproteobacteria bacterium]